MSEASKINQDLMGERQFELNGKTFVLHNVNIEDAMFAMSCGATVLPLLKDKQLYFMSYDVSMVSPDDHTAIKAINGWRKLKSIIDRSFTVNGQVIEKAVNPFDNATEMVSFYSQAIALIVKS